MTSFMTRSKSRWSSSHGNLLDSDDSVKTGEQIDDNPPYVYYSVLCTSDSKGNITLDNVKTKQFDSDVTTVNKIDSDTEEEIDDIKEQRYGFRIRRSRKFEDDEFESSLGVELTDHSGDDVIQPVPSSDDETYDITTDNWTFVRGAKRKVQESEKKTSPKRIKKKIQKNSLRIKFKSKLFKIKKNIINNHKSLINIKNLNQNKPKIRNASIKKESSTPDPSLTTTSPTTNTPDTTTTATATCSSNTSSTVTSSFLLYPSITKKLSHKIRCGYNATSSKLPEIRHIRRRRLNRALRNEGSPKDDISTSSEDERQNEDTASFNRSKRLKSSKKLSLSVDSSRKQQRSNYQLPTKASNSGLKIVIRRQNSDSIIPTNNTAKTPVGDQTPKSAFVTSPNFKSMTPSPEKIPEDNLQSVTKTDELCKQLPEATVVLERALETKSANVDAKIEGKVSEQDVEPSNEEDEQNDEDKIQKELSTFVHHRPYQLQENDFGSKGTESKLRRNLKTIKSKKRRRKKRGDKDVVDTIDSKRTALRLDMELPGHNWLLKKHQIKDKKLKKDGEELASGANVTVEQLVKNTGSSMVGIVKPFNHLRMATTINRGIRDESPPRLLIVDEDDPNKESSRIPPKKEISKQSVNIKVNRSDVPLQEFPVLVAHHNVLKSVPKSRKIPVLTSIPSACSGVVLTANHVQHYNKVATDHTLNNDVPDASHNSNSLNAYSYKMPATELPVDISTNQYNNHNTFQTTSDKDANAKSTNTEKTNPPSRDKVPVPKEDSSEIESTIKISNCVSLALDLSTKKVEEANDQPLDLSVCKKAPESPEILDLSIKKCAPDTESSSELIDKDKTDKYYKPDLTTKDVCSNARDTPLKGQKHNSVIVTEQDKGVKRARLISPSKETFSDIQPKTCSVAVEVSADIHNHEPSLAARNEITPKQSHISPTQLILSPKSINTQISMHSTSGGNQNSHAKVQSKHEFRNINNRPSAIMDTRIEKKIPSIPSHLPPVPPSRRIDLTTDSLNQTSTPINTGVSVNSNYILSGTPDTRRRLSTSVSPSNKVKSNALSITSAAPRTPLMSYGSSNHNMARLPNANLIHGARFSSEHINGNISTSVSQTSIPPYALKHSSKQVNSNAITVNSSNPLVVSYPPAYRQGTRHHSLDHQKPVYQASVQQLEPIISNQQRCIDQKIHDLEAAKRRLNDAMHVNKTNGSLRVTRPRYAVPPPPKKILSQDNIRFSNPRMPITSLNNMFGNERIPYRHPVPRVTRPTAKSNYPRPAVLQPGLAGNPYSGVLSPNILRNQKVFQPGPRGVIHNIHAPPRFEQRVELRSSATLNRSASFPSQPRLVPEFPVGFDPTVRTQRQLPAKSSHRHVQQQLTQTRKTTQKMPPPQPPANFIINSKAQLNEPIVIDDDIIPSQPISTSQRQQRSSSMDGSTGIASLSRLNFIPQYTNNPIRDQATVRQEFSRQAKVVDEVCVKCRNKAFFLCSGCRNVWYCSKECQLSDWSKHAAKCSG